MAAPVGDPPEVTYPEITMAVAHLRDVLGDTAHESLAQAGARMTDSAKAKYALEQTDESVPS